MFGMGMGELLLILVVALLFVGPDKLPNAARAIGKGIRDFRKHTKDLQSTIEQDEKLGEAVRELRSALQGDPARPPPPPARPPPAPDTGTGGSGGAPADHSSPSEPPRVTPAAGAVAKHRSPVQAAVDSVSSGLAGATGREADRAAAGDTADPAGTKPGTKPGTKFDGSAHG
jgi:sec-independent protein translocase protein TatB